jgi:hypothetical protein
MKSKLLSCILALTMSLASLLLSGCTAFGIAVGSLHDHTIRRNATGPATRVLSVKPGQVLTVTYADSHEIIGVYQGLGHRAASEYVPLYAAARDSLSSRYKTTLPMIGDTLSVAPQSGETLDGELVGFGLQRMWLKSPRRDSLMSVPLCSMKITDSHGVAFDTLIQRNMMEDSGMPSLVTILLRQNLTDVSIPTDSLSQIRVHVDPNYWLLGGAIGLLVDAAVVALIASGGESMEFDMDLGGSSSGGGY